MSIKFIEKSPILGDQTQWFDVETKGTIGEFIDEVLKLNDRWVTISILHGDDGILSPNRKDYNFYNWKKAEDFPTEYLEMKPKRISANGGWGRMDYYVRI